jgi:gamma-glutamyltranspeptidase/glutathione hydrolase
MPPGSSGGSHIIQILNILEHWDIGEMGFGSTDHIHHFTEALKIAFADRQQYMGDPWKVSVPVKGLISKKYASERAKEITIKARYHRYGDPVPFESQNTTHLSAADSEGNMVAATQTLFNLFGSKVMVPGTGVFLNNCMGLFDPNPGRANSVGGGKRMLSSMAPTIVLKEGEPFMCLGTPGGTRIFPSVCQALINVMDFKMTLQQAVETPRVWTMGIKGTPEGKLYVEPDFPIETISGLGEKGHEVEELPKIAGGMNGVIIDDEGVLHGAACWRADGTPMGYSGGRAHPKGLVEFKV